LHATSSLDPLFQGPKKQDANLHDFFERKSIEISRTKSIVMP